VVAILEVVRIEEFVKGPGWRRGRPPKNRKQLARAFVIKAFYNWDETRDLIEELRSNPNLRLLCGYESASELPSEATFSRAFAEFAQSELAARVHAALVEQYEKERLVGHISRDSTEIEGREKPVSSPKADAPHPPKRRRGRPRKGEEHPPTEPTRLERQRSQTLEEMLKELPKSCDRGTKKNSRGHTESWNGYKLHVDSADGQIPISVILTSASVHDSQAAIPLMQMTEQRVTPLYELMDAAYDAEAIRAEIRSRGRVPIIDANPRRGEKKEMDPATRERFKERTTAERVFGRLKEEFGGAKVRVRGYAKVLSHLMFGILVLTADQLLRLVQ